MVLQTTKFRQLLSDQSLDAALVSSIPNIIYLTGFAGFSPIEREAYLLITKQQTYLFSDGRYTTAVKEIPGITVVEILSEKPFTSLLLEIAVKHKLSRIGFEANDLTVSEYVQMKKAIKHRRLVPAKNIHLIRMKKSADEITKIQKACLLADTALKALVPVIKLGITEKQLAWELEKRIKKHGAELSFPSIVAFGKNSAVPHHHTSGQRLMTNDIVLIDFGVRYENYCSDMTRTFFIGRSNAEQKKMYQTVLTAQQKAVELINNSLKQYSSSEAQAKSRSKFSINQRSLRGSNNKTVKLSAVDSVARKYIISKGYPSIPYSLGHGIGIEVHEAPRLSPKSDDILEEGMVFSIEPGTYLPAGRQGIPPCGVRIEDLFAIKNGKLVQLTMSPKQFFKANI